MAASAENSFHTPTRNTRNMSRNTQTLAKQLRDLAADADTAQPYRAHTPAGFTEPVAYIKTQAARTLPAVLGETSLPSLFGADGRLRRAPDGKPAGSAIRMDAALVANSRAAQAGARVLIQAENTKAHAVGPTGGVVMERRPVRFSNIEAAPFGVVDINTEANAPIVALPVFSTDIDWRSADIQHLAVRFEIPRSARRAIDAEDLWAEIVASLTLGLSRAADQVMLAALAAAPLTAFTLAKAAAEGLQFDELRGLVGTNGAGAVVAQDGAMRVAGVASELTADTAATIVGAFNRCAIAVNEDISIHAERLGKAGHLSVTCWAQMLAVVPDANKFWTVA